MYYGWVLDKPIYELTESINKFLEDKFAVAKVNGLDIRRIVEMPEFKDSIHKINNVSQKALRIYSWAFKCHYDHIRFYSYILLESIKSIDLYEQPDLFKYICAHIHANTTIGPNIDVQMCLREHFTELEFERLREKRDELLNATDKYALVDYPFKDDGEKSKWFEYRQILRDLPGSIQNPFAAVFPSLPGDSLN
tara:strand:+ start:3635 stop:4216 length:582 start_codon:yes stop_codon:yes gene_type:complete